MEFVKGSIGGEKEFNGKVFPLTLVPPQRNDMMKNSWKDLVEKVKKEKEKLSECLSDYGAILFRGFKVESGEEFEKVVESFGWDEFPYEGAADRNKVASRIYTANEAPLHVFINFHHEMALIRKFAPKIFFYCLEPAPEGGETAIVRSDVIVEEMEKKVPEVVEKLTGEGFKFVLHTKVPYKHGNDDDSDDTTVWQRMLKTKDKLEAQKRALETLACNAVKFNEDGTAEFTYGPMNPIKEFNGKRVWFNTILGYQTSERDGRVAFTDGTSIPTAATDTYSAVLEANCVDIKWLKGDVLLVDNLAVQHARRVGKPPRSVLVSLCI
ncbi:Clavaminate synthase-like protein [Dioscorea alata]|uniref:Clavaminate synthase-like protein n=1 Tax=Dioscorea alata TaxID=55571 RepID=A0ACB7WBV4_DIOAL|nr:Clavaminate synthase-like protein [Dioscorea alata]